MVAGVEGGARVDESSRRFVDLSRGECLELLSTQRVGRLALSIDAMPFVVPVNFAMDGGDVVFRTATGTKFDAALHHAVVGFEVDEVDPDDHTGWSVLVVGVARLLTEAEEIAEVEHLRLVTWAPGERGCFVRISGERITGRRLTIDPSV